MLEPCLLQPCFRVAGGGRARRAAARRPWSFPRIYNIEHMYTYTYIYIYIYICIHVYTCRLYIYIYIYDYMICNTVERERERERESFQGLPSGLRSSISMVSLLQLESLAHV